MLTVKEIMDLSKLQKSVAAATSVDGVISIWHMGVQMTTEELIDTFGNLEKESDDEEFYLSVNVNGVRFYALTNKKELEELS